MNRMFQGDTFSMINLQSRGALDGAFRWDGKQDKRLG